MTYTIYHNPKCSKCRATLEILNNKGVEPNIIEYLKNPPSKEELAEIIQKLNIQPTELIRFKEEKAKELGISATDDLTLEEWLTILTENPVLIERPIVLSAKGAVIGRPPKNVLALFG
ncbi:MAG: arsenate reductase (glutaredoxin) [SAR324 cluster bacterium]|jgi:arsenate reductase|nr:arsenate reductase (glutaredoxin) [SAR324 cluster bacterium]MCH2267441.1 arsenate reductase (glutaredoxin) [SAR324 cluster bacterium]|tara:strand:- start:382 stop:735 length:354 start_codon:yes stop_codon:yes gene_type:complete